MSRLSDGRGYRVKKPDPNLPVVHEIAVGELRLYRGWYLTDDQRLFKEFPSKVLHLSLRSSYIDYLWTPDANEAVHINGTRREHPHTPAPMEGCGCGIYGVFDAERVQAGDIVGVVEYWGKVRMGNLGIRAQFARVVELAPGLRAGYHYTRWKDRIKRARLAAIGEHYDAKIHFSQKELIAANAGRLTKPGEFGVTGGYFTHDFG